MTDFRQHVVVCTFKLNFYILCSSPGQGKKQDEKLVVLVKGNLIKKDHRQSKGKQKDLFSNFHPMAMSSH